MKFNQTLPQIDFPSDMIHLGIGQPSNYLLPSKEMEKAAEHCLSKGNNFFPAYGEERGNSNFRQDWDKAGSFVWQTNGNFRRYHSGFDRYPYPVFPFVFMYIVCV